MRRAVMFLLGAAALSNAAAGQPIYSNVDAPVFSRFGGLLNVNQAGNLALNEVTVSGGGSLASITFSAGVPEIGPISPTPLFSDAVLFIFADDGDNNPDDDADNAADLDQLLFQSGPITLPPVAEGEHLLHTVDVSSAAAAIPAGATLWVGVLFTNTSFGQVGYSPPAIGSTSSQMWLAGTGLSSLGADTGFGLELVVVPAPAATAIAMAAGLAALRRRR